MDENARSPGGRITAGVDRIPAQLGVCFSTCHGNAEAKVRRRMWGNTPRIGHTLAQHQMARCVVASCICIEVSTAYSGFPECCQCDVLYSSTPTFCDSPSLVSAVRPAPGTRVRTSRLQPRCYGEWLYSSGFIAACGVCLQQVQQLLIHSLGNRRCVIDANLRIGKIIEQQSDVSLCPCLSIYR